MFAAVAVFRRGFAAINGGTGDSERAEALSVSDDFFHVIGIQPLAGRALGAADNAPAAAAVTVISHDLWLRRFGGDLAVVGKTLRIGGVPHTVVGVMSPRTIFLEDVDVLLPLVPSRLSEADLARRDNLIFEGIARLTPDATPQQAEARMRVIATRLEQDDPGARTGWTNGLVPLREYIVDSDLATALYVLLAAVGAVLLIACANLANLSLVRGAARARELGVRLALGATRQQLVRQLVAEGALLGLVGGTLGVLLAGVSIPVLGALVPADAPFLSEVSLDSRVMLASAAVTFIAIVGVGVLPALRSSGVTVAQALKEGGRGSSEGRSTLTLRSVLVVVEIASAVVLLVSAGLLLRSFDRLSRTAPGADIDRVLAASVAVPASRYTPAQRIELFERLTAELSSQPAVEAAAITSFLPAGGGGFGLGRVFLSEGQPQPPAGPDVPAMWCVISPRYFQTLGISLLSGRAFDARDNMASTPVMIVSEAFAARMFPAQNPVGQRVRSWRDENVYREIVAVVRDVPFSSLADRGRAIVYVPHAQQGWGGMTIAMRAASGSPASLAPVLRNVVNTIDPELPLSDIGTMDLFARNSIARERLSASLMGALAVLALALAVLGIYGIMSYSVALRRQEMGVRLALGAAPRDLYRLVLGRGVTLTLIGLLTGIAGALAASKALQSLLYETSTFDPMAFGGMATILALSAVVACLLPARRAAAADPLLALRSE
jgi:putative ABC transport system permease protein